jgi:hypothetical protein
MMTRGRKTMIGLLTAGGLATAACAPAERPATAAPVRQEITYETSPCFGACPVYAVTVRDGGRGGTFEGKRFTAIEGRRDFALTAAAFDAFARSLRALRTADPAAHVPGGARCRLQATDQSTVTVTFRDGDAAPRTVPFYYGCHDPENAALAKALRDAPKVLPIAAFIGAR